MYYTIVYTTSFFSLLLDDRTDPPDLQGGSELNKTEPY